MIAYEENTTETENFFSIRRVDFMENKELTTDTPLPTARKTIDVGSIAVPGHLSEFHKRATKDLEHNESLRVADLLSRFQDSFSKGEWDLGLTHLAEHEHNGNVSVFVR